MDHGIAVVLDTAAIRSYMTGEFKVGEILSRLDHGVEFAAMPVLCLAEAYRYATSEHAVMLEVLAGLPAVIVTPVNPDDAPVLGGWSRLLGSHDLAHAALDAAAHMATLLTSERKALGQVLADGWPIIDL